MYIRDSLYNTLFWRRLPSALTSFTGGTPFHFKEFLEGRGHLGFSRTRFTSDPPSAKGYHIDPSQGFSRKYILGTREPGTAVFSSRGGILIRGGSTRILSADGIITRTYCFPNACLPYNKRYTFCKRYGFDTEWQQDASTGSADRTSSLRVPDSASNNSNEPVQNFITENSSILTLLSWRSINYYITASTGSSVLHYGYGYRMPQFNNVTTRFCRRYSMRPDLDSEQCCEGGWLQSTA